MDERGLWRLFFATGSPLVWLALRRLEREREEERALPASMRDETVELI